MINNAVKCKHKGNKLKSGQIKNIWQIINPTTTILYIWTYYGNLRSKVNWHVALAVSEYETGKIIEQECCKKDHGLHDKHSMGANLGLAPN